MARLNALAGAAALAAAFAASPGTVLAQDPPADAVPFPIGYVELAEDARFNEDYAYFAVPVRPLGRPFPGAELGIIDNGPIGNVIKVNFTLQRASSNDVGELSSAIKQWVVTGTHFVLVDLPGPQLLALANAVSEEPVTLLNLSAPENDLREANCRANVIHIIPSLLMQTDGLVQYLIKRKWSNILVLQGPSEADAALVESITRSAGRFGAIVAEVRPFLLSNDPRNRDQSNVALITGGGDYDVVWVADSDGEFARNVPYQTNDPRPIVGSAGLVAHAWHWSFDRQGAPQVNARFELQTGRRMGDWDWAASVAIKAIVQSVLRSKSTEYGPVLDYMLGDAMNLDGTKGNPMSVRSWDHQLRQPLLLAAGNVTVDRAPVEGFLHQTNELDTLGVDQPEVDLQLLGNGLSSNTQTGFAAPAMPLRAAEPAARDSVRRPSWGIHALRAMRAIIWRELFKFAHQFGRLLSAIVRPGLWLIVFAAGFQDLRGVSIIPPYQTYVPYQEYILPGLIGIVLLFNGMQSSLSLVYDREVGTMRLLLTAPLPRWYLLFCKLIAGTILSVVQAYAFLIVAWLVGVQIPWTGWAFMLPAMFAGGFLLGAIGLLLSVYVRQLENFAGTMNFVIFPMFFLSSALYPLWRLRESGAEYLYWIAMFNPFTYAVELVRFAAYGKFAGIPDTLAAGSDSQNEYPGFALLVVLVVALVCFLAAVLGYDPQRGLIRRRQQQAT